MSRPKSIDCAAIRVHETVYFLPRPHRHWKILRILWDQGVDTKDGPDAQGFLTTWGRYVDRHEGMLLARRAKQTDSTSHHLFTELLW